ncbi:hypothetical protein PP175_15365 [Aneurinibacillus sp. Ricciae_BoGa-3]|uniref:hypothetical protein n=1 Tax=Aneurinibacillus sp. Ricciae_BoGa-3 TaxID=3022697 RepID=UPI0023408C1A|nr:hypothetical protein [Aneurinibacillus sp. Ricciae_BoGa-3]WCK52800.1 hypothetical protein PP175_15365 [Aneurinibacillus sp. Ricciae_BoGa-3]
MLSELRNRANLYYGYATGTIWVEGETAYLQTKDEQIQLDSDESIEIYHNGQYESYPISAVLKRKTGDGWSLFTGMEARYKKIAAEFGSRKYFYEYLSQFQAGEERDEIYTASIARIVKGSGSDRIKIQHLRNIIDAYEQSR